MNAVRKSERFRIHAGLLINIISIPGCRAPSKTARVQRHVGPQRGFALMANQRCLHTTSADRREDMVQSSDHASQLLLQGDANFPRH